AEPELDGGLEDSAVQVPGEDSVQLIRRRGGGRRARSGAAPGGVEGGAFRFWDWTRIVTVTTRIALLALASCIAAPASAEVPAEQTGQVEQLALPPHAHWAWVGDLVLQRTSLIDLDDGRFLGMINGGYGTIMPICPGKRPEVYVPS